ncbi:TsaB protein [Aquipluma nitroreducens]|uniref:TsaB protein n=1 Tax=Aquipluma nitroreducens TaxID=2010828 RepID=A0A5K7S9S0_9BACT|nr:tRNA (adenosine(37)-N6)-threonylcarbamoyltransferase complex dimerization subunit type 1 TsaB [Aquipluma nitroreducens]BBE18328.1 TsaB protein [Aquipluma nitroreducens]
MALILIIETSTEVCSVSLLKDGLLIDFIESDEGQNHARLVTVFAENLLSRNNLKPNELSAVTVSKGPGSYTGLRIGVSTAKGICYAGNIPLIAIGTLEAMAKHVALNKKEFGIPDDKLTLFCPMIDARRMEVFSMLLDESGAVLKPISADIIDDSFLSIELSNKQVVFFGNGSEKCGKVIKSPNAIFLPNIKASARHMTELAWQAYNKNQFEDVAYFEPFYLKDFITTVSKKNMLG